MAIWGARPCSGGGELEIWLGNDAARAAMNVSVILFVSQAGCGAGVADRETGMGDDVSGTMSPPESAVGFYFARNHL